MNIKQTAVEWLVEKLENEATMDYSFSEAHKLITLDIHSFNKLYQQAKEMEKQQHGNTWDAAIDAHEQRGHVISRSLCDFDDYYNETYKSE